MPPCEFQAFKKKTKNNQLVFRIAQLLLAGKVKITKRNKLLSLASTEQPYQHLLHYFNTNAG